MNCNNLFRDSDRRYFRLADSKLSPASRGISDDHEIGRNEYFSDETRDAPAAPSRRCFAVRRLSVVVRELGTKPGGRRSPGRSFHSFPPPLCESPKCLLQLRNGSLRLTDTSSTPRRGPPRQTFPPSLRYFQFHAQLLSATAMTAATTLTGLRWTGGVCAWLRGAHQALRARLR